MEQEFLNVKLDFTLCHDRVTYSKRLKVAYDKFRSQAADKGVYYGELSLEQLLTQIILDNLEGTVLHMEKIVDTVHPDLISKNSE